MLEKNINTGLFNYLNDLDFFSNITIGLIKNKSTEYVLLMYPNKFMTLLI